MRSFARLGACAVLVLSLVVACGGTSQGGHASSATPPPSPSPSPGAARAPLTPPGLRLPTDVRPRRYDVILTIDPTAPTMRGSVAIDLTLDAPRDLIWLHAQDLTIHGARLVGGKGGGAPAVAELVPGGFLAVRLAAPAPAGDTRLVIDFTAPITRRETQGTFAQETDGAWYVYTQHEPLYARRSMPCFDEPSFKVPWRLRIKAPEGLEVISNREVQGSPAVPEDGWRAWNFPETPPLPSYLVAWAVGPFERVPAGTTRGGAPVRIVVPRGHAAEAAYAAEVTAPIMHLLEDYLGVPYPYDKLDLVPVPDTYAYGAMEHPGLVTFLSALMLHRPDEITGEDRRAYAEVAIHEFAHQWFGNLVTAAWWDDIWLNEALATWAEARISEAFAPAWKARLDEIEARSAALWTETLTSSRRVREPIRDANDILDAFDGVTYVKGGAVLRAVERWIGEEVFRAGLRAYLKTHAHGTATFADFARALDAAAGRDASAVLGGFYDRVGAPIVTMELACPRARPPEVRLTQRPFVSIGGLLPPVDDLQIWRVPVCVRWGAGKKTGRACTLLESGAATLPLGDAPGCPDWLLGNADGAGYYRPATPARQLGALLVPARLAKLSAAERLALVGDLAALVDSGDLDVGILAMAVERLAFDRERAVREAASTAFTYLDDVLEPADLPAFRALVARRYAPAARKAGFRFAKGDDDDERRWRPELLWLAGGVGRDPTLVAEATKLAWAWLDDHGAVAPELVDTVLAMAAGPGDERLWARVWADAQKTEDLEDRRRLLEMLGAFRDPALVAKNLTIILEAARAAKAGTPPPIAVAELWDSGMHGDAARDETTRDQAWAFLRAHYDEIVPQLPEDWRANVVWHYIDRCDPAWRVELAEYFTPRNAGHPGGPRTTTQALEIVDQCIAKKAKVGARARAALGLP